MADHSPTLDEEVWRAGKARQILEDEVFKEAIRQIEEALLGAIARSAFTDEKLREKLCQRYAILHDLLNQLRSTIETGKLAKAQLEHLSLRERIRI